jgi:hypothetical protein
MEGWQEFYSLVASNYQIEIKDEVKFMPGVSVTPLAVDSDIIEYDEGDKIDTEMIKVEIINENEQFEVSTEWIEEEEKISSPKRAKRNEEKIQRQSNIIDSADDQRIKETAQMYCEICQESLESLRDAKSHFKVAHETEGYLICCDRKFKQRCRLVEHVNTHYNLSHPCPVCSKSFDSKSYLSKHLACHDSNKQFVSFQSSLTTRIHLFSYSNALTVQNHFRENFKFGIICCPYTFLTMLCQLLNAL